MSAAAKLDAALKSAGIPIEGISIGRWSDKATWRVDFAVEPTKEQRDAAQAVIDAFNPDAPKNQPEPQDPRSLGDLAVELDALKKENAALRLALIKKGAVSEQEIEAQKPAESRVPVSRA
jgi:hypothetical protein